MLACYHSRCFRSRPGRRSRWTAQELSKANTLYEAHCAVCHSASRGGYVGPGLHKDRLLQSVAGLRGTIMTGIPDTLMPPFVGRLPDADIRLLAKLIKTQPPAELTWSLEQARDSLEVLVDEDTAAGQADLRDRHGVRPDGGDARGRYGRGGSGDNARLVFLDGKTNKVVGEIATPVAPISSNSARPTSAGHG